MYLDNDIFKNSRKFWIELHISEGWGLKFGIIGCKMNDILEFKNCEY